MKYKELANSLMIATLLTGLAPHNGDAGNNSSWQSVESIRLLESGDFGATFELSTPGYTLEEMRTDAGLFQTLQVDGYGLTDQPGQPQLPATSVLLGIPADAIVTITTTTEGVASIPVKGVIAPVPLAILGDGGISGIPQIAYRFNQDVDQQGSFYPESPAIIEEYGWLRNQRYIRIGLYPFQYNRTSDVVLWSQRVVVQVNFVRDESLSTEGTEAAPIITMDSSYEALLKNHILNYDVARSWRTIPPVEVSHQTTVSGERLRIVVKEDGLYRIGYADLITAGMAGTDPRTLKMTNQGLDVAIQVIGEEDGILNDGDYILFYGEAFRGDTMSTWYADESQNWITFTQQLTDGTNTLWHPSFNADMLEKYNDENVYWLQSVSDELPPRMQTVDGSPGSAPVPAYYHTTAHAEVQWIRWEFHYTSEDTWFWRYVTDTAPQLFTTELTAIYQEPFTATVRSEYVGYTYSNIYTPDHHTVFHLNSRQDPINESYWDGRSRHKFEVDIPSSDLIAGTNTLTFNIIEDDAVVSRIFIDWFEIDYLRRFVSLNDSLEFPGEVAGTWRYQTEGFSQPDIKIYDVTDPRQPKIIENTNTYLNGTYRAEFQYTHEAGTSFYVVGGSAIRAPVSITRYIPPDLRSTGNGADYLIISHADFLDTAQALADYRGSQGLRARVIDVADLYNEFNEGIRHPIAIKNFLEYTYAAWVPPAPLYVVLVGDGHWDLLASGYTSAAVYMPPNLSWVDPSQGEVDSSNLLVTIAGDDPLPDMLIGRIPVNTPLEFQNIINKISSYEQAPLQSWQLNNTFIADNTPDAVGNFPAMADYIINGYIEPGFTPVRIYEDDFGCPDPTDPTACQAVTQEIIDTVNITGTLFMTYIGHAAVQNWSHERIFVINNIASLTNADRLPVVLSMDCLDGYWFHPTQQPSMAEVFLRTANYGAVATFSPTGLGVGLGHYALMEGFFGTVYQGGLWGLGEAALGAKINLYTAGYFRDMIQTFTIFGDPALRFPDPYGLNVSPTSIEHTSEPGTQLTYTIQISNSGSLTDVYTLTVGGNSWPTMLSSNLVALAPGETADVLITINVPQESLGGMVDIVVVQVRSDGDASENQAITIQTSVVYKIRMPIMRK